jgi:hypothetical protein
VQFGAPAAIAPGTPAAEKAAITVAANIVHSGARMLSSGMCGRTAYPIGHVGG